MKVWELMAILSKCHAGDRVVGWQPGRDSSDLRDVDIDNSEADGGFVSLEFDRGDDADED